MIILDVRRCDLGPTWLEDDTNADPDTEGYLDVLLPQGRCPNVSFCDSELPSVRWVDTPYTWDDPSVTAGGRA